MNPSENQFSSAFYLENDKTELSFKELISFNNINPSIFSDLIKFDEVYFPDPWTENGWVEIFSGDNRLCLFLILDKGPKVLGFSLFQLSPLESLAHLLKIIIHPELRKSGLGKELFTKNCVFLKKLKLKKVFLEVGLDNQAAMDFYGNLGFEALDQKKQFYSSGQDALTMLKFI